MQKIVQSKVSRREEKEEGQNLALEQPSENPAGPRNRRDDEEAGNNTSVNKTKPHCESRKLRDTK